MLVPVSTANLLYFHFDNGVFNAKNEFEQILAESPIKAIYFLNQCKLMKAKNYHAIKKSALPALFKRDFSTAVEYIRNNLYLLKKAYKIVEEQGDDIQKKKFEELLYEKMDVPKLLTIKDSSFVVSLIRKWTASPNICFSKGCDLLFGCLHHFDIKELNIFLIREAIQFIIEVEARTKSHEFKKTLKILKLCLDGDFIDRIVLNYDHDELDQLFKEYHLLDRLQYIHILQNTPSDVFDFLFKEGHLLPNKAFVASLPELLELKQNSNVEALFDKWTKILPKNCFYENKNTFENACSLVSEYANYKYCPSVSFLSHAIKRICEVENKQQWSSYSHTINLLQNYAMFDQYAFNGDQRFAEIIQENLECLFLNGVQRTHFAKAPDLIPYIFNWLLSRSPKDAGKFLIELEKGYYCDERIFDHIDNAFNKLLAKDFDAAIYYIRTCQNSSQCLRNAYKVLIKQGKEKEASQLEKRIEFFEYEFLKPEVIIEKANNNPELIHSIFKHWTEINMENFNLKDKKSCQAYGQNQSSAIKYEEPVDDDKFKILLASGDYWLDSKSKFIDAVRMVQFCAKNDPERHRNLIEDAVKLIFEIELLENDYVCMGSMDLFRILWRTEIEWCNELMDGFLRKVVEKKWLRILFNSRYQCIGKELAQEIYNNLEKIDLSAAQLFAKKIFGNSAIEVT